MSASDFKDVLRQLRLERGWSQSDLADRLQSTKSTVSNWEQGTRIPKVDMLEEIADLFNVDVDYLLGKTDKTTKIPQPYNDLDEYLELLHKDPRYRSLLDSSSKLSSDALDNLVKFIDGLNPDN